MLPLPRLYVKYIMPLLVAWCAVTSALKPCTIAVNVNPLAVWNRHTTGG